MPKTDDGILGCVSSMGCPEPESIFTHIPIRYIRLPNNNKHSKNPITYCMIIIILLSIKNSQYKF